MCITYPLVTVIVLLKRLVQYDITTLHSKCASVRTDILEFVSLDIFS